jgi:hypothetical protein
MVFTGEGGGWAEDAAGSSSADAAGHLRRKKMAAIPPARDRAAAQRPHSK